MNKLEKILGIIALLGLIFKFAIFHGGSLLLALSLSSLAFLYFYLGFAFFNQIGFKGIFKSESYKGLSKFRIIGAIGVGVALSMICIGILFKLQNWYFATLYLYGGLILALIIIIVTAFRFKKSKGDFYYRIFKRVAILGILGLLLLLISDLAIVKIQFRNHPSYINAYELYLQNPNDKALIKNMHLEYCRATMSEAAFKNYLKQTEYQ
jgi:hypothetical protein